MRSYPVAALCVSLLCTASGCSTGPGVPLISPVVCTQDENGVIWTTEQRLGRYTLRLHGDQTGEDDQSSVELLLDGKRYWSETGHRFFLAPVHSQYYKCDVPIPKKRFEEVCGQDINGDGWPELVIEHWSGGAHASYTFWIWSLRREPVCLIKLVLGNGHLAISDVDYDGVPELLAEDDNFGDCPINFVTRRLWTWRSSGGAAARC